MQVLPEPALPAGNWPKNLVVGYVGGYTYEVRASHPVRRFDLQNLIGYATIYMLAYACRI